MRKHVLLAYKERKMKLKVYVTKIHSVEVLRNGVIAVRCDELYGHHHLKNTETFLTTKEYNMVKKRGYYRIYV